MAMAARTNKPTTSAGVLFTYRYILKAIPYPGTALIVPRMAEVTRVIRQTSTRADGAIANRSRWIITTIAAITGSTGVIVTCIPVAAAIATTGIVITASIVITRSVIA
jgi:hypothetical protein